jgi:hypothetical protein
MAKEGPLPRVWFFFLIFCAMSMCTAAAGSWQGRGCPCSHPNQPVALPANGVRGAQWQGRQCGHTVDTMLVSRHTSTISVSVVVSKKPRCFFAGVAFIIFACMHQDMSFLCSVVDTHLHWVMIIIGLRPARALRVLWICAASPPVSSHTLHFNMSVYCWKSPLLRLGRPRCR